MKKIVCGIFILAVSSLVIAVFIHDSRSKQTAAVAGPYETDKPGITLIIDAGHGGADGGAVSDSGLLRESELNIDIAQRLELLSGFFGVRTVMTRSSETIEYSGAAKTIREKKSEDLRNRLNLINMTENAVLISIHQNKYTSSGPFGAQVLYAKTENSKEFAEKMQAGLIAALNPNNYRAAARIQDSIYLMNHIKCPAVLIECGFLSNPSEEALLQTEQYRTKIAAAIAAGYLKNRDIFKNTGGTNESQNSVLLY